MATKALNYTAAEINQRLNLAGTAVQPSALDSYYTKTVVDSMVVVDLSVRYATSYASLSAALTALNADTNASAIKIGGMSIKFINSTTNKYEQWYLKASSWSTNTYNWERYNDVTTFEQSNTDIDFSDEQGNVLVRFANGHIKTKNFDSSKLPIKVINKAVFMGDSITHGVYSYFNEGIHDDDHRYNGFDVSPMSSVEAATAYQGIHYYFSKYACCECINLAKRGSGYVQDGRNLGNALEVATAYDFSSTDFVALCFGINDYINAIPIGSIETFVQNTVIGNMAAVIQKILTDNPLCKIVAYSPYNSWGQVSKGGDYIVTPTLYGTEETNYALGYNLGGGTLQDYIDAIDAVCQYYGIQHVVLSKSNVVNRLTIKEIMIDGLHPSKVSYPKLAAEIYGKGNFGA